MGKVKQNKFKAFLYSFLIVVPIYVTLLIAYLLDVITGFIFIGAMNVLVAMALIAIIFLRKHKLLSLTTINVLLLTLILLVYEMKLLDYENLSYIANGYGEPEELIEGSEIHLLKVDRHSFQYVENEEVVRKSLKQNNVQVFDIKRVKNLDRYLSKSQKIKEFFKLDQNEFQSMSENVKSYLQEDRTVINNFLDRDNMFGNSAGLGLGLVAKFQQGYLQNEVSIGVTGTLEPNGEVQAVGGIKEKMLISEKNNFPFIMLPSENLKEAQEVKNQEGLRVEILSVNHIDEAVKIIRGLNKN